MWSHTIGHLKASLCLPIFQHLGCRSFAFFFFRITTLLFKRPFVCLKHSVAYLIRKARPGLSLFPAACMYHESWCAFRRNWSLPHHSASSALRAESLLCFLPSVICASCLGSSMPWIAPLHGAPIGCHQNCRCCRHELVACGIAKRLSICMQQRHSTCSMFG